VVARLLNVLVQAALEGPPLAGWGEGWMSGNGGGDPPAVETELHGPATVAEKAGMERIRFFSDAVFAIAITLLVLNIALPRGTVEGNLAHRLDIIWPEYAAFAFTFLLIGLRWLTHLIQLRYIHRYDNTFLGLNLGLLCVVAFLPFASRVLAAYPDSRAACFVYLISMAFAGLISTFLWFHACWHKPPLVGSEANEYSELNAYARTNLLLRWITLPILFSVAIVLVFSDSNLWAARLVAFATPVVQIGIATLLPWLTGHQADVADI
jgi:uncharacterized membrane protein